MQIQGLARVNSVTAAPRIASGDGSAVTVRFITRQVDIIARIEVLAADGHAETIQGTTIHPVWSVDRDDWVPLGELEQGEQLLGAAGPAVVLSHVILQRSTPVYNIEVHGEHVYEVGELGVVVHNSGELCGDLGAAISRGMKILRGPNAPDDMVDVLKALGRDMDRNMIREAIHTAKRRMNIGPAEDLIFDRSGGMWDSRTGEFIGKIWELL